MPERVISIYALIDPRTGAANLGHTVSEETRKRIREGQARRRLVGK